jgi:hypothetical protein
MKEKSNEVFNALVPMGVYREHLKSLKLNTLVLKYISFHLQNTLVLKYILFIYISGHFMPQTTTRFVTE